MSYSDKEKRILLTGGGTGGSVTPLLAMVDELRVAPARQCQSLAGGSCELRDFAFLFLGTKNGPERRMVEKAGMEFKWIYGGKLRRYFSWRNFLDPFFILIGFAQSFFILFKWRPNLVVSAGSFVSVPVVWAAWLLGVPVLVHQQDVRPGLANKLAAPFAKIITVTFEKSLKDYGRKAVWTGNPVRQSLKIPNSPPALLRKAKWAGKFQIPNNFRLNNNLPIVLIMGGGTGAMFINKLVEESLSELLKFCQIIHITGKDKKSCELQVAGYKNYDFLNVNEMTEAYALADVVISRCGMGVLTELSYLGKSSILIPIADSHQEENAEVFKQKNAAIVLNQRELTPAVLVANIKKLIEDEGLREELGRNIKRIMKDKANEEMVKIIFKFLGG